jgi:hypothetical protein
MSLFNSATLRKIIAATVAMGELIVVASGLGSGANTCHSLRLGQHSTGTTYCSTLVHVALRAITQQLKGGGAVSPMAYSTPACSFTDLRDHKCNRPNVVGKDEDYCS